MDQTKSKAVCEIHDFKSFMSKKLKRLCFSMSGKSGRFCLPVFNIDKISSERLSNILLLLCVLLALP